MRINHNIAALNTHRQLANNTVGASKSLEKLSSGFRINRAGDDAAGLAISEKMRSQIRGLDMAVKNSQDSISLIQTAEGAMNEVHSILQRMRELSVQAVNDTNTESDRQELQKEINQLTSEINRVGNTTEFNEKKLLNGDLGANVVVTAAVGQTIVNVSGVRVHGGSGGIVVSNGQKDVEWSSSGTADFTIKITTSGNNGFDWSKIGSGLTADLIITRTSSGFTVDYDGADSGGNTLVIDADKLAFNSVSGKYSYNSNGISFEFTTEQAKDWLVGTTATVEITKNAVKDYATETANLFATTDDAVTDAILGTISLSSSGALNDVAKLRVAYQGDELTVELKRASGGTTSTYTYSVASGGVVNFNSNGISFKFTAASSGAGALGSGTFDLKTKAFLETVTSGGTAEVTEDASLTFQTGSNQNQTMALAVEDIRAAALKIVSATSGAGYSTGAKNVTDGTGNTMTEFALNISTSSGAANAISVLDDAIKFVSAERSKLGAVQNRLEHTINNLGTSSENLTAAESRIRDVDMAKEMMTFTKDNILTQAAQAMLAQANQQPQGVLQLLR
jgi:flagellin